MTYRIPLSYNPIDVPALTNVLTQYEGKHHNQIVTDFEGSLSELTSIPHVIAVNSGTSAIHLALLALGIGKGDVVVAPTFTYVATINPIMYVGATPVLVDCESESWNMDTVLLKEAISSLKKRGIVPKAIMIVHTYGMPAKMDQILEIAHGEGISIIEDAAESFGASYKGKMTGTLGSIGIYSFNNNKVVTTYGGGALITKNEKFAEQARWIASQARESKPFYEHNTIGYNYLMSPLSAAMGLCEIPRITVRNESRRRVFTVYQNELKSFVEFQTENSISYSNRWLSTFLFKNNDIKDLIFNLLIKNGIETRYLWRPMHLQPLYGKMEVYLNGCSEEFFKKGLCLPSCFKNEEQQAEVVRLINGLLVNA